MHDPARPAARPAWRARGSATAAHARSVDGEAPQARGRRTQEKILDAAVTVLIEDGYAKASTLRVQQVAGVTRGRLLHHYGSRDELLVAAVGHLAGARIDRLHRDESWAEDPRTRVDEAIEMMWEVYRQDFFWAACELWLGARHNEQLRDALGPSEHRILGQVRAATDRMFGPAIIAHPDYGWVRDQINTSMRGTALAYAFDRRDPRQDPHLPIWQRFAREQLLDSN